MSRRGTVDEALDMTATLSEDPALLATLQRVERLVAGARGDAGETLRPGRDDPGRTVAVAAEVDGSEGGFDALPTLSIAPGTVAEDGSGAGTGTGAGPDFWVEGVIAEGGMGRVLAAHQRSLRRPVALKMVRADVAEAGTESALVVEGRVHGALEHPNVVPVHALGRDVDGRAVLVMKRVDGVSWEALLRDPAHPAWANLRLGRGDALDAHVEILRAVCNALAYAHSHGVVHRDVKPQNVMVGAFGEVYLVDWGIARDLHARRAAREEPLVGTPGFLAPEMLDASGARLGPCTDVYLLGATLHYALTGELRHPGATIYQSILSAVESAPYAYPASVPEELAALCNRATSKDPAQRPESAQAFADALTDFLRHRASVALADAAGAALAQFESLGALPAQQREKNWSRDVRRAMTECRFGYLQALSSWPENPRARLGLRRCLERTVEHEVETGDAAGARDLLDELEHAPESLRARVEALEGAQRERDERARQFHSLQQEHDWTRFGRARTVFLLASAGVMIAIWRLAAHSSTDQGRMLSVLELVLYMGVVLALTAGALALAGRNALGNRVNRQTALGLVGAEVLMFLHRCQWFFPAARTAQVVSSDMMIVAGVLLMAGLSVERWIGGLAVLFVLGAFAARAIPGAAGTSFAVTLLVSLSVSLARWQRARGQKAE